MALQENIKSYGLRGKGYSIPDNRIIKTTKAIHLLSATAWAGGALAMQALCYLKLTADSPDRVQIIQECLRMVDACVVLPGLAGSLITGLIFSTITSIGFFKYFWIGLKWMVACCAGFWGGMFLGPWGDRLIAWLSGYGLDTPLRIIRSFILPETMWQGFLQLAAIFTMCLISVYRPLSLRRSKRSR
ncbi:MAG: hypothetical protein K6G15_05855 [Desulfovibrio sp.]|nr:hypothetical protein [Desulfovibrio sp.]